MPQEVQVSLNCRNCDSPISPNEIFCANCGYPENGTVEQRNKFESRIGTKKRLLTSVKKEVRKAKVTLIVLGCIAALSGLYFTFITIDLALSISNCIIAIFYLGLAVWSDKQPFGAILTALILYGTLILINAAIDPSTLIRGVLWKVIIIGILIKGLNSGNEAKKVMKELEDLGVKSE